MARPRDRDEAKSEHLNMRVTPTLKAKLDAVARIAGEKTGPWVEEQLVQIIEEQERSAGTTDATRALLNDLERHIFEIEQATGKQWHKHIGAWAAVQEMLWKGPIVAYAPAMAGLLAALDELREKRSQIEQKRMATIGALDIVGIKAEPFETMLLPRLTGEPEKNPRDIERDKIEKRSDLPEALRESLLAKVAELETLENELQDNAQRRAEVLEPVLEAMNEGRQTYEQPTTPAALAEALRVMMEMRFPAPARAKVGGMFGARPF